MTFAPDPRIQRDSLALGHLPLCQIRLQKNALFPWLVLLPQRPNVSEIIDLTPADQQQLWQEVASLSHILTSLYTPDKLNLAALGNIVPQLHLHLIARFSTDSAWPHPVWGKAHADYTPDQLASTAGGLKKAFAKLEGFVPVEG